MTREYWAHPTVHGRYVRPDGSELLYESRDRLRTIEGASIVSWPDHAKSAAPLQHDAERVIAARGVILDRKEAVRAGFKIETPGHRGSSNAAPSWRAVISNLPEALQRPAATAELLTNRTEDTLSIEQAKAFLRGLPVETNEQPQDETTMTTDTDPKAARLAEIANSMAAVNRNNGYSNGKAKAAAPSLNGIDPSRLKRLAEIRLGALMTNGKGYTQEAKTLKLALDTHETVGTPLHRLFTQLGVDTDKMLPKSV
ncbi:hypothetical protein OZ411_28710 [Bradyrhizobium sp. Arg237L]|uniref:hypothetical protein n=1 Tax=Bradyrhizobium sp. Arg237L TaxID=3003352 RepID=UPI00249DF6B0|nr:hypothetical protein [Bradyrhizobium sp. Arg237L]MDI4236799.1 hypothetical protein [Bradyrhizobium sp. Arg237L]